MADTSGCYTAVDGTPRYTASQFAIMMNAISEGIVPGVGNELATALDTGLDIETDTGFIWSHGRWFYRDAADTVTETAAAAGNNRLDRIVVEFDVTNKTAVVKISAGVETAGTPSAPALLDTATKWQEHLAYVTLDETGVTDVDDSDKVINGGRHQEKAYTKIARGANQTSGTFTEFDFLEVEDTTLFDISVDDTKITAPRDGRYAFSYCQISNIEAAVEQQVRIYVNGFLVTRGPLNRGVASDDERGSFVVDVIKLNKGDYVQFDGSPSGGYTATYKLVGSNFNNWLTVTEL